FIRSLSHRCDFARATTSTRCLARCVACAPARWNSWKSHRSSSLWARDRFPSFQFASSPRGPVARLQRRRLVHLDCGRTFYHPLVAAKDGRRGGALNGEGGILGL